MEHRLCPRRPLQLDVELFWREHLIGKTHSTDASLDGMQLEARDIDLHPGQMVEMDILPQKGSVVKYCHTRALVIHSGSGHVGLMLDNDTCIKDLLGGTRAGKL